MTIHDEMRANRSQKSEERRRDQAAQKAEQRKDQQAKAKLDAQRRTEKARQRQASRDRRQQAIARRAAWVKANALDLGMVVIVAVPGLLAWTSMAAYGLGVYGTVGLLLPLFSEMAMWLFSFWIQRNLRANRPVWLLVIGLIASTAVAGVLNFIHGAEMSTGRGVVMALVSISGVLVHQAVLYSDRERRERRTRAERIAARRVQRMERAAARSAVGQLSEDGSVRLVIEPGTVTLNRIGRHIRRTSVPGVGADGPGAGAPTVADEVERWLKAVGGTATDTSSDQGRDRGEDTPVPCGGDRGALALGDRGEDIPAEDGSDGRDAQGRWTWDGLVAAFREAAANGEVDPTSQRNVRMTLKCSRDRAKLLVDLYASEQTRG